MPDFDLSKLQDVALDISPLKFRCRSWHVKKIHRTGGLITFFGRYRPGSAGSDDAMFIKWRINEFCDRDDPQIDGLVVDCRELDYTWGDNLDLLPSGQSNPPGSSHWWSSTNGSAKRTQEPLVMMTSDLIYGERSTK